MQEQSPLEWEAYIQQILIIIKYKKEITNKIEDFLSRPPTQVMYILEVCCATYDAWKDMYATNPCFSEIGATLQKLTFINEIPFLDYTIRYGWL